MPSRQKKYPNTDTFEYYNANQKGKLTTDCVARAISTAYLESKGWTKQKQPRKANNSKYTDKEFCKIFKGTCVANIGGVHVVCVRDGKFLTHRTVRNIR